MGKVAFEFDPFKRFGIELPSDTRDEAKAEIADYLKEQVLSYIGDSKSPVKGGPWKRSYSKDYKAHKSDISSAGKVNLELFGGMLDALEVVPKRGSTLELQVSGEEADKADGNNRGTYGQGERTNNSQARRFIPLKGEDLRPEIWAGIESILRKYESDQET